MKVKNELKEHLIEYKFLYTIIIVSAYLIGRLVPLYGVDTYALGEQALDAESLMMQVIGGDINRYSLFALGISPYMVASIFSSTVVSLRKNDNKGNISPVLVNRVTILIALVVAIIQGYLRTRELPFIYDGIFGVLSRYVSLLEMVTGAMLILWLAERNKKYGIGGQTALIFVNVIMSIISIVEGKAINKLVIPIIVSYFAMLIIIVLENAEKRIPVQRISIHNIYSDKNYLAIKLNPIGIMPVMFATAFFTIPQMLFKLLSFVFESNETIVRISNEMTLQHKVGVISYVITLFVISVFFTFIFVNPRDISEQLLKSGDSIINVHAGKDTKAYIVHTLLRISIFSSTIMCICIGVPMMLRFAGIMDSELTMLPSSVMILTGIWSSLQQEIVAIRKLDSYKPFIN